MRVGFRTRLPDGSQSDREVVTAVTATAQLLEELGHRVGEATLPALGDGAAGEAVGIIFGASLNRDVARWSSTLGRDISAELEPSTATFARFARATTALQWVDALETLQSWSRTMAATWSDLDALLLPVMPEPPRMLGETTQSVTGRLISFTVPFNITGEPAISLPLHRSTRGLPVGVQLVAPMGREDRLFRLAGQLERARPWTDLRPTI